MSTEVLDVPGVLAKTRELFAETHWGQGAFYKNVHSEKKAKFCAVGGIRYWMIGDPLYALDVTVDADTETMVKRRIEGFDEDVPLVYDAAIDALAQAIGVDLTAIRADWPEGEDEEAYREAVEDEIYGWNDAARRTLSEVLDAFTRAEQIVKG